MSKFSQTNNQNSNGFQGDSMVVHNNAPTYKEDDVVNELPLSLHDLIVKLMKRDNISDYEKVYVGVLLTTFTIGFDKMRNDNHTKDVQIAFLTDLLKGKAHSVEQLVEKALLQLDINNETSNRIENKVMYLCDFIEKL